MKENPNIFDFGNHYRDLDDTPLFEIDKIKEFLDTYENNREDVCEYFKKYYPKFDGIDFGSNGNFIYKSSNYEIILNHKKFKIIYSKQISDMMSDWDCKKFMDNELKNYAYEKIIGIIPYKIFQASCREVKKENYKEEISKLIIFGREINKIKEKYKLIEDYEEKKRLSLNSAISFCRLYNETIIGKKSAN